MFELDKNFYPENNYKNYDAKKVKSNIIELCFILINYILNQNVDHKCRIEEWIINYIYIFSIKCNIQFIKCKIVSIANKGILSKFDGYCKGLLEHLENKNLCHRIEDLQNKKLDLIQNKKELTILNYFIDFYEKLLEVTNDSYFKQTKKEIEKEIEDFLLK